MYLKIMSSELFIFEHFLKDFLVTKCVTVGVHNLPKQQGLALPDSVASALLAGQPASQPGSSQQAGQLRAIQSAQPANHSASQPAAASKPASRKPASQPSQPASRPASQSASQSPCTPMPYYRGYAASILGA